jgi:hypothetical protein
MSDMTRKVKNSAEVTACSGDPTMDSISVSHHQCLTDIARHVRRFSFIIYLRSSSPKALHMVSLYTYV